MTTVGAAIDQSLWAYRLGAGLLSLFGALALLLATIGIYGIMSFSIDQRFHEFGLRSAIGASPRDVLKLIVLQGMRVASIGLAIGAVTAFLVAPLAGSLLWVNARDPLTYIATASLLAFVALLANLVPAGGAASVSPVVALRGQAAQRG